MSRSFLYRMGSAIALFFGAMLAIASPAAASPTNHELNSFAAGHSIAPEVATVSVRSGSVIAFADRSALHNQVLMTIAFRGDTAGPDNPDRAMAIIQVDRGNVSHTVLGSASFAGMSNMTIGSMSIRGADAHDDGSGSIAG